MYIEIMNVVKKKKKVKKEENVHVLAQLNDVVQV